MKLLLAILCFLVVSCATKRQDTPPPVTTPKVRAPQKVEKPDLKPASVSTKAIEEANKQLAGRVTEASQANYELNRKIAILETNQRLTREEASGLQEATTKLSESLNEASVTIEDQAKQVNKLQDDLFVAEIQIAKKEMESTEKDAAIVEANERITLLTENSQTVSAEKAYLEREVIPKLKTDVQKIKDSRWKWRGSTLLLAAILAALVAWRFK